MDDVLTKLLYLYIQIKGFDKIYCYSTSGSVSVDRILPDSITTWETKVMCVSQDSGVGLSEPSNVNVFKPFFIDVLLPYSIKRNSEILHLPVVISNYLSNRLDVSNYKR